MPVIGHYWGIDEIGVFVVPAVLAVLALRWAEKKARANREKAETSDEPTDAD